MTDEFIKYFTNTTEIRRFEQSINKMHTHLYDSGQQMIDTLGMTPHTYYYTSYQLQEIRSAMRFTNKESRKRVEYMIKINTILVHRWIEVFELKHSVSSVKHNITNEVYKNLQYIYDWRKAFSEHHQLTK